MRDLIKHYRCLFVAMTITQFIRKHPYFISSQILIVLVIPFWMSLTGIPKSLPVAILIILTVLFTLALAYGIQEFSNQGEDGLDE
jgi:predicted tellurium resistance membrane protein TerC